MSYESPELDRLENRFEEFDIWIYLEPIIKNIWTIALIVAGLLLMGILYNLYATPIFRAKSSVIIRQNVRTNLIKDRAVAQPNLIRKSDFRTKVKVIKSSPLVKILAERMVDRDYFSDMFEGADYDEMDPELRDEFIFDKLTKLLMGKININNPEGTNIVEIFFQSSDPVLAKDLVNLMAGIVVEYNQKEQMIILNNSQSYLIQEIAQARKDLEETESKLYAYRVKNNIFVTNYDKDLMANRRLDLTTKLIVLKEKHEELDSKIRQLKSLRQRMDYTKYSPVLPNNQNLVNLNRDMVSAEVTCDLLLITYDEKHPEVIKAKQVIQTLRKKLDQELMKAQTSLDFDLNVVISREKFLDKELTEIKNSAVSSTEKDIDYAVLDREAQATRETYETLLAAIKEIRINTNDMLNNVIYVHERSTVPYKPIKPRVALNLMACLVLGFGMGISFAFGKEYMDQTIRTPDDVAKAVELPVLSTVPLFSSSSSRSKDKDKGKAKEKMDDTELPLLVMNRPKSLFSEGITSLRTHLNVKMPQDKPIALLITSSAPREGKSVIASNLGLSFAIDGKKTLIIDADMHRPSIHKMFGEQRQRGLYDIIVEALNPQWSELNMDTMNFGDIRHLIRLKQWSGIVNLKWDSLPSPLAITFREGSPIGSNITSWQEKYSQPSGFPPPKDTLFSLNEFEITDLTNKENSGEKALDFIKQYPRLNESSYFTKIIFDHYIRKTGHENLHVLTAGANAKNTNEILGSDHMRIMLQILMETYDRILIDSPPSWPLSDVSVLSPHIDGVLWVCRAGEIPKTVFTKHVQHIQAVQPNIIGVIINAVDLHRDRLYYYGYSSYYYYNRYYKSKYYSEYYSEELSDAEKDGRPVLPPPPT